MMKIGFLQITNPLDVQWFPPLSFGYLKSYLEREFGKEVDFFRMTEEELFYRSFDLLALSTTSQDFGDCCDLVRRFRKRNADCPIIIGGHHITYLPETLPPEVSAGVLGEGEVTFADLVRLIQEEGKLAPKKLREIPGVAYWEDGKIIRTTPRPFIENLDLLPIPYRQKDEIPYLFSSRGCPFRCAFCASSAFWGKMRYFSAEYVFQEIGQILERFGEKVTHLTFMDDLMTLNLPRLRKMAALLNEHGFSQKVTFSLAVKAGRVDDDLCRTLKAMNVSDVFFGAESGVDRNLKFLKGDSQTVAQNQETLNVLARHRIPVSLSMIIGVPGETEQDLADTYNFISRNMRDGKTFAASVNILMPMPGTPIWEQAQESGVFSLENVVWNRLRCFAHYKNSSIGNIEDWVRLRLEMGSYYLNEKVIPHQRFLSLLVDYERRVQEIRSPLL
jgi:anaerobic magnesium-protoporphyrin IX monomethyl ester cyclase